MVLMAMAIHILSGRRKGQEFLVPDEGGLLLSRTEEGDLAVNDPEAPYAHARLELQNNKLTLTDLDSGQRTFVNRAPVETAALKEGDRIRIGKITCMVIALTRFSKLKKPAAAAPAQPAQPAPPEPPGAAPGSALLSGSLEEMALVGLLQLLCVSGKNGVLCLTSKRGAGKICIHQGHLTGAEMTPATTASAKRVLFRLLRWKKGTFQFVPPANDEPAATLTEPTEQLLIEAACENEMFGVEEDDLPPFAAKLKVLPFKTSGVTKLTPGQMLVLGLVKTHGTLVKVMDNHPEGDAAACRALAELLQTGVIAAA